MDLTLGTHLVRPELQRWPMCGFLPAILVPGDPTPASPVRGTANSASPGTGWVREGPEAAPTGENQTPLRNMLFSAEMNVLGSYVLLSEIISAEGRFFCFLCVFSPQDHL